MHFILQIRIGGGNDAGVEFHELVAAQGMNAAVGKGTQKGLLHAQGGVADFVKHERAAFGSKESALARLLGFRIRAFDVAEERIHEKAFVERAAVDGDEGAVPAV